MGKETVYHEARLISDGTIYTIGDRKYQKEVGEWEIISTNDLKNPKDTKAEEASALAKIEEFMSASDIDLGTVEEDDTELDYHALKDLAKAKGLEIKGNPKKEVLIEMLSEA